MIKNYLNKKTKDGNHYRLVFYNNGQVFFKNSDVAGNEAEFSEVINKFSDKKAIKYWDTIQ